MASRLQDVLLRGLASARPLATAVAPGTLYYATDTRTTERCADDGLTWQAYSGAAGELGFYQLTGDVTAGPGVGTQAATIAADAVTYAKLQNVSAASRLLGRGSAAGAGDVEEITLGTNLALSGTTLNATGGGGAPAAHAASHQSGGTDAIPLDTLAAPTDVTTLNASTSAHGLLRKLSGTATQYLDGSGAWTTPATGTVAAHHTSHETGGSDAITALSGSVITTGTIASARLPTRTGAVGIIIDGGGSAITTGVKADVYIPFACTITQSTLIADVSGSCVVDLKLSSSYATVPTVSIVASAPPTLSSAASAQDTTLTSWTVSVATGSRLRWSVTSASTITRLTHTLTVTAT